MGDSSMHDLINITVQTQKPVLVNTLEVGTLFIDYLGRICTITKKGLFYSFLGEKTNNIIDGEYYTTPVVLYNVAYANPYVNAPETNKTSNSPITQKPTLSETLELSGLKLDDDEIYLPDTLG